MNIFISHFSHKLTLDFLDERYHYTVTAYTGDKISAATYARVFVEIFGEIRSSGEVELVGKKGAFNTNR